MPVIIYRSSLHCEELEFFRLNRQLIGEPGPNNDESKTLIFFSILLADSVNLDNICGTTLEGQPCHNNYQIILPGKSLFDDYSLARFN